MPIILVNGLRYVQKADLVSAVVCALACLKSITSPNLNFACYESLASVTEVTSVVDDLKLLMSLTLNLGCRSCTNIGTVYTMLAKLNMLMLVNLRFHGCEQLAWWN